MKKLLLAFLFLSSFASAQTVGIKVATPIIKNNPADNTITGYAHLINGANTSVVTKAGLDSILMQYSAVKRTGMERYVISTDSTYRLQADNTWLAVSPGIINPALYKLKSDSTSSTGYQTIGNLGARTILNTTTPQTGNYSISGQGVAASFKTVPISGGYLVISGRDITSTGGLTNIVGGLSSYGQFNVFPDGVNSTFFVSTPGIFINKTLSTATVGSVVLRDTTTGNFGILKELPLSYFAKKDSALSIPKNGYDILSKSTFRNNLGLPALFDAKIPYSGATGNATMGPYSFNAASIRANYPNLIIASGGVVGTDIVSVAPLGGVSHFGFAQDSLNTTKVTYDWVQGSETRSGKWTGNNIYFRRTDNTGDPNNWDNIWSIERATANMTFYHNLFNTNTNAGVAGTDSLLAKKTTGEIVRVSPTYYATSASIPTNYWTTNSTQTGLTGDKTSTGTHTVGTMNTTNASGIKIFNITGANSEYLEGSWSANTVSFQTKATGTGTVRNTIWGTANRVFNIADMPTTLGFYQFTAGTINPTGAVGTLWSGTWSASSGSTNNVAIGPTYNQSGTASYNAFLISPYEQTTGSGTKYLANFGTNTAAFAGGTHTRLFSVLNTGQIFSNTLTASTALVSDASKNIVSSSVTSTEMALLSGKTSLQSAITLTSFYADATATGSAADAYNYTLAANSLTANGQYIEGEYVGVFGGGGGIGSQIVLSFGGTTIYDTGPFLGTGTNPITYTFYRTGTSTARCTITYVSTGGFPVSTTADLTGLNFTTTNVIKASIVTSVGSTLTMKAAKLLIYK